MGDCTILLILLRLPQVAAFSWQVVKGLDSFGTSGMLGPFSSVFNPGLFQEHVSFRAAFWVIEGKIFKGFSVALGSAIHTMPYLLYSIGQNNSQGKITFKALGDNTPPIDSRSGHVCRQWCSLYPSSLLGTMIYIPTLYKVVYPFSPNSNLIMTFGSGSKS